MKTLRKSFICLALAAVVLFGATPALAQGRFWQNERFQKELLLSAEQIARLEAIYQNTRPSLVAQKSALDKLEDKLSKVIADPKSDEARVLQAAERLEGARADLSRTRTLQLFRMRRVLTDEQNLKMKAMHEKDRRDRERRPKGDQPHHDTACHQ